MQRGKNSYVQDTIFKNSTLPCTFKILLCNYLNKMKLFSRHFSPQYLIMPPLNFLKMLLVLKKIAFVVYSESELMFTFAICYRLSVCRQGQDFSL